MSRSLVVNDRICIPAAELNLSFARSSGPGGQNVNKVNSKAMLRWNVRTSPSLPDDIKSRFFHQFANRINQEGEVVLFSDRFRDQPRNVTDCYEKLRHLIQNVVQPPRRRIKTKPSKSSNERRLRKKQIHSQRKQSRQRIDENGD